MLETAPVPLLLLAEKTAPRSVIHKRVNHVKYKGFVQLMVDGALGVTGPPVQNLVDKVSKVDNGCATVLLRPTVADCAWGRLIRACHVTKVTVQ